MQRIFISVLISFLCLSLLSTSAAAAPSADTDQAGGLVERGLTFARKGQFTKAAELFERAVKLNPDPTILHSLARAREEMGSHALAFETFRQALELDPQYIYAQDARDRMAFLERLLKSTHARIRVTSTPGGADVHVQTPSGSEDARLITPFSYWAPAGELNLEGRKDGFMDASHSITVKPGTEESVELVLRPVAKKGFLVINISRTGARIFLDDKEIGRSPLEPMAIEAGPHAIRVETDSYEPIERSTLVIADKESLIVIDFNNPGAGVLSVPKGPWGPVLLGSGAMALVGGIVMHLSAISIAADSRDKSAQATAHSEANESTAAAQAQKEWGELRDEAHTNETIAFIGYGVSAALIGFGAYMVKGPSRAKSGDPVDASYESPSVSWTPVVIPSHDGLYAGTLVSF